MQIKTDWQLAFDAGQFIRGQGPSFDRLLARPARRAAFEQVLDEIVELVEPAACWDRYPVAEIRHEKVVLQSGVKIGNGPVATVVGGASELIVAVCTAGRAVSDRVEAYQREKDLLRGMLLSDLGSWAVDMVRQQWCQWVEDDLARQGLRASTPLSPGESEWSIMDQGVIFSLLDAGQIGVSLSGSMVMSPLKSLSLIMGAGSQPMGVEGTSNCDFCTMKERCQYRQMRN